MLSRNFMVPTAKNPGGLSALFQGLTTIALYNLPRSRCNRLFRRPADEIIGETTTLIVRFPLGILGVTVVVDAGYERSALFSW